MRDADPLIGQQLANFRLERRLGRGGMASVYYGWDVKLQRPAAVKVITVNEQANPDDARRLINEARTVAAWRHPNILQIYYADELNGLVFFAMEYIQGRNLADHMAGYVQAGRLTPNDEVLRIGRAIAAALDYAHQHGVIHRDVKPANVLVAEDGRVVLADFGLALSTGVGTLGQVFGSPHYIAPEQARNSAAAVPQSDLYALGIMLYEMLTGAVPFDDPSPMALALQHLTAPPPPPRQLNPQLSPAVEAVLLKALSKQPEQRYASGQALIEALAQALQSPAGPAQPPRRPAAPAARRGLSGWVIGCLAALSLLIIAGLGAGLLYNWLKPAAGQATPRPSSTTPVAAIQALPTETRLTPTPQPSATALAQPTTTPPVPSSPTLPAVTSTATPLLATATTGLLPTPSQPPSGDRFALYYDATAFYIKNLSTSDRSIFPLAFERLGANDTPLDRFDGWRWGNIYSTFRSDYCLAMRFVELTQTYLPPECQDLILVLHQPTQDRPYIFWTAKEGSTEFRVLWNELEAGRCAISAGYCEVYLP
jgi:hypothetical protein